MLITVISFCQHQRRHYMPRCSKQVSMLLMLFIALSAAATEPNSATINTVYYPGKPRQAYDVDLLQLALSYPCQHSFQLQASNLDLPKGRAFDLMNARQGIDVMFGSASLERIKQYRAVPFPIMRGLMGLRVALVSKEGKNKLQHLYSLSALAKLRVGQFTTWSDTEILRANNFNVETGSDVDGLYQMLAMGRIDYFPRSVLEVQQNQQQYAQLQLEIDPHILLYYPTAVYFYVAKDNTALADTLLCGLEQAQKDGQLDSLFHQYYGGLLQQLQIDKRRIFKLQNPLLPDHVPLQRPELWYPLLLSK
ncbi:MAG: transporter substrate-binding domain-containing protein [Gammaproteobacteria bacterium]|nr:transporter substrate-binding domain-containing protein [Gammaproteobacteria bacterium]MBU2056442.1 transporter substrate-binding domain-containing protein [Gammaproteobacteria bacterium]MBU2175486.1 transporter substrate-binding domain-containing protein [Gammaproteobacteria bacterium]MBU2246641.1 transporter substrate-binding domain-containing protein [Gammaproteobacteria bacterium]MBU2345895.1 transporter substrate-binding domain-containing protein [Gammaproteobacteria bacterium]